MALELKSTLSEAPLFVPHRYVEDTNEATTYDTERKHGMNGESYETAHVQVIPIAGITVTVEVLFWSDAAGKFISEQTPLVFVAPGAVPFSFSFEVKGRVFLVRVNAGLAASKWVRIDAAGFRAQ